MFSFNKLHSLSSHLILTFARMNLHLAQGSATLAPASAPKPWSDTNPGCPSTYRAGTAYDAGAFVSVPIPGMPYNLVYRCASEPTNKFCGMLGYEAGTGQYSDVAWSEVGSCSGTLSPTSSPSFEALTNYGGCPGGWEVKVAGEVYEPGDTVSVKGFVFGKR